MRKAALYSAGLHLAVIVFTLVGLPALFTSRFEAETAIVVEVVNLADKPAAKPAPPPKPEAPKPPPAPPKVELPPEPPPEPVAEKAPPPPEVKPPERKVEPPKPEPPKPVAKPEPVPPPKPAPPQETAKAVPEPPRKPPPPDAFEALLKDLARERDSRRPAPTQPQQTQTAARSLIDEQRLAATLAQMVMSQVTRCWSIPAGAKDAAGTRVGIRISLNPDGSLSGIPMVENAQRMSEDATFRTVAESALRALRHPRCTPLRLPYEHYNAWKLISLNFDPKDVLSQ